MANQLDPSEIIAILEYGDQVKVSDLKQVIAEYLITNKDAWLVNVLVDAYITSYSLKCADILHTVREPHDKQLLERLNEHVKGENKLPGFSLLGHLILKQPPWLHLVLNHPIFTTILKCLKVEIDVPILVTALLCLTSLLPVDPVKSSTTFVELFAVLERLVFFMYHKPANLSDVYSQHLEQTVSAYFYRLYGMFPCNFLVSLRMLCSQPDFVEVFTNVVMPLVEKLRMHPLLLTGSKEKELAKDRWKQKDIQDIIAECATFSLDPVECGAGPLDSWPPVGAFSGPQLASAGLSVCDSLIMANAALQLVAEKRDGMNKQALVEPASEAMVRSMLASGRLFGAQARTGLSTPPPQSFIAGSDTSGLSQHSNTSVRTTPFGGSSESSAVNTSGAGALTSEDQFVSGGLAEKRQSSLNLSLSSKATAMTSPPDTSHTSESSVPPSPFLKDFGFDATPSTASSAVRKISFEPLILNVPVAPVPLALPTAIVAPMSTGGATAPLTTADTSALADQKKAPLTVVSSLPIAVPAGEPTSAGKSQSHYSKSAAAALSPSVDELSSYIDGLEIAQEDVADNEVLELTGSSVTCGVDEGTPCMDHGEDQAVTPVTSETVAAFMKKMNRIRFISMNFNSAVPPSNVPQLRRVWEGVSNTNDQVKPQRSRSCPDVSSLGDGSDANVTGAQLVLAGNNKQLSVKESFLPKSAINDGQNGCMAVVPDDGKAVKIEDNGEEQLAVARGLVLPYEHLLPASQRSCAMCGGVMSDASLPPVTRPSTLSSLPAALPLRYETETFTQISQYVEVGSKLYSDAAAQKTKGNLPSVADDVVTLKGQVHMLQMQLLFERHRREMHTKRNRGQLRHVLNAAKFEIENTNLKKLLTAKEDENRNVLANLRWLEQQALEAKKQKDNQESSLETAIKNLKKEVESVTAKNAELQATVDGHAQERDKSYKLIQALNSDLFTLQHEVDALQERADASKRLHEEVVHLNKELLLMGELQQKYQQRLAAASNTHNVKPELHFLLEACKQELASAKQQLEQKSLQHDALKSRVSEFEDFIKKKDELLVDYKRLLDGERQEHSAKLTSLEEHCSGQRKVQVALHAHILQLYSDIGQLKPVAPTFSRGGGSSSSSAAAGAVAVFNDDDLSASRNASSLADVTPS